MASLSWMCIDEKLPFLFSSTFTLNKAMAIAIINTVKSNVSIIFPNFAGNY